MPQRWVLGLLGLVPTLSYGAPVFFEIARLEASGPTRSLGLAQNLDISGRRVISSGAVGVPGDVTGGAVYVFDLNRDAVQDQSAIVVADDAQDFGFLGIDNFARSIALDGDRIVAGAPQHRTGGISSSVTDGAAYVFDYDGTNWSQSAKLTASDGANSDGFGGAIDVDGDRVVVGALGRDGASLGDNHGGVYVYNLTGAADQTEDAILTSTDPSGSGGTLGQSVAVDGDRVAAGRFGPDGVSALVYDLTGAAAQTEDVRLTHTAGDGFAAREIDLDGDRVITGDSFYNSRDGRAYVYDLDGSSVQTETALLTGSTVDEDGRFGYSVEVDGDRLVVGAIGDGSFGEVGAGYFYDYAGTPTQSETIALEGSDSRLRDFVGSDVAIDGDLLVLGASGYDGATGANGAAYVFLLETESYVTTTGDGTWNGAGNWTGANGLGNFEVSDVFFDPDIDYTITGPTDNTFVNSLRIGGGTGTATLDISSDNRRIESTTDIVIESNGVVTGSRGQLRGQTVNNGRIQTDTILTFGENLTLNPSSILSLTIGGTEQGVEHGYIRMFGDLVLGGTLDISLADGYALETGRTFEIVDFNLGAITGMFDGLNEGDLVASFGDVDLFISYLGGDGDDVILMSSGEIEGPPPPPPPSGPAVPAPQTFFLLVFLGGILRVRTRGHPPG